MKKHLITASVLAALFAAGTLFTGSPAGQANAQPGQGQGQGQGSAPVTIVGPLPVPVTGTTTVAGSVAATQSGPWNVSANQAGTWNVGINNTPLNPVPVQFKQTLTPFYAATGTMIMPVNSINSSAATAVTVPLDKILALEYVSYTCVGDSNTTGQEVNVRLSYKTYELGESISSEAWAPSSGAMTAQNGKVLAGGAQVNVYAQNGPLNVILQRTSPAGEMACAVYLSGRYLDR
jgi:hypothetical protein